MKFDTTVTLGSVLQIVAMVSALFMAYSALDKRITLIEYAVTQIRSYEVRIHDLESQVLKLELNFDVK